MTLHVHEQNFIDTLSESGARANIEENGGIGSIVFANGSAVAWRAPRTVGPGSTELHHVARMVRVVAEGHGKIARIRADKDRSVEWKARAVEDAATEIRTAFEAIAAEARLYIEKFAALDAMQAVPPVLAREDAVGAQFDREVRDRVCAMKESEQIELASRLLDGEFPRELEAILRGPFGVPRGVLAETAHATWIANRDRADPAQAGLRRDALERIDFLRSRMGQVADALPPLSPAQTRAAAIAAAMAGRT